MFATYVDSTVAYFQSFFKLMVYSKDMYPLLLFYIIMCIRMCHFHASDHGGGQCVALIRIAHLGVQCAWEILHT